MNRAEVIVIGAGASGIAAATRLVQNGFQNVTVLEAEDRLGGRCNTVALGDEHIDLGAQWIHGETLNVVYEMAAAQNLTKDSVFNKTNNSFFLPNGEKMDPNVFKAIYNYCNKTLDRIGEKKTQPNRALSLGEVFMTSFNENLKELKDLNIADRDINLILEWYHKLENSYYGSDSWHDVSFEGFLKYKACEGNLHVAWKKGGYSNIIDLLLQKIPKNKPEISLNVLFGKEVTKVTRDHKVVVQCCDGSVLTADHVIVSVPLGVLKYNVQSMFDPALPPDKLLAINTISAGVAEKLFIQFPHRWWPGDSATLSILLDPQSEKELQRIGKKWLIGIFAFIVVDNAPNTLCGWVGGNSAREISDFADDVLRDDLYYFLKRYMSDAYSIPAPVKFARSNWFGNPHFRGVYSFVTVQANVSNARSEVLSEPICDDFGRPVLMFAGEATHPYYFSTVHGAVETGWREADRLISHYSSN